MAEPANDLLEILLRECQAASPQPWYPSVYVKETGLDRTLVDADLDRLRMGNLLKLTDWVQDKGQGYALTREGEMVLQNPRLLRRLRDGKPVTLTVEPIDAPPPAFTDSAWSRGEAVRAVLVNPSKPIVTMSLLVANILVFMLGMAMALNKGVGSEYLGFSQDRKVQEIRFELGALSRGSVVLLDQWWRLIGYCFVHGGVLHLLFNMYFLYSLGPLVETMWGPIRYLVLYVVSGLGGGVAVVLANQAAVGASGALCGLLASFGMWVFLNKTHLGPHLSSQWLRGVMTNVLMIAIISMLPGVSAMGHLGGGLAGAIIAVPLVYSRFGRGLQRPLGWLGSIVVPVICLGLVLASVTEREQAQRPQIQAAFADEAAWLRLRSALREADRSVHAMMSFLQPLLKGDAKDLFGGEANRERAMREVSASRDRLKQADQALKARDFAAPDLARAAKLVREYLDSWSGVCDLLFRLLETNTPPSDQDYSTMRRLIDRSQKRWRELKSSPIFSS